MTTDETYGFDEDFQKLIVAASLQDPSFLKMYDDVLLPGYFDYDYLSSILRTARELTERLGEVPSKLTVVEEIKEYCSRFNLSSSDRDFVLNHLEDLYATRVVDVDYVRERVVEFGQQQALRSAVLKIVTLFSDKRRKRAGVYEKAKDILDSALSAGISSRDMGLSVYPSLQQIPMMAAASSSGTSKKIPTMIPTLDKKTMGGPGRGEVWVVVGLPGRGKSAFLVNIGVAALKNGFPVFHYTLGDLNEIDVSVRYAARLTLCSTYEVIVNSEAYQKKARMLSRYNPHLHVKYFPSDTATMGHIRAHVARLRAIEEIAPGLIIVDYPEELQRPYAENLYLSGDRTYSQLNKLAAEFDALVWVASQPKNWTPQHKKDVIRGQNMGESWRKFQKVDGMVSWNMDYEEELLSRGRLWVDKTRRARSYYLVHMDTDLERMLIKEGKPPEEE